MVLRGLFFLRFLNLSDGVYPSMRRLVRKFVKQALQELSLVRNSRRLYSQ